MIIKKTYARHRSISLRPEEPLAKRRRVEADAGAVTSIAIDAQPPLRDSTGQYQNESPSPVAVKSELASEPATASSTPASSPPPASNDDDTSKNRALNVLLEPQGRHVSPFCLKESISYQERKKQPPDKPKPKRFTQLTLDLGQPMDKNCKECGMTYRPSNVEDREMHKKYHAKHSVEIPLSKQFVQGLLRENVIWSDDSGHAVVKIGRTDDLVKRSHAEKALGIVEKELGGVGIPSTLLWSTIIGGGQRYAVFLDLHENKCLGACVVQRIEKARRVVAPQNSSNTTTPNQSADGSICVSDDEYPATLGISRIWTSSRARRKGIARRLLEISVKNFDFAAIVQKDKIAFSQPTDSGARLARTWFGNDYDWLVYAE